MAVPMPERAVRAERGGRTEPVVEDRAARAATDGRLPAALVRRGTPGVRAALSSRLLFLLHLSRSPRAGFASFMLSLCFVPARSPAFIVLRLVRDTVLAKPNYSFEKRQRDLEKKRKQEEKRLRKLAGKKSGDGEPAGSDETNEANEAKDTDDVGGAADASTTTGSAL